MAAVSVGVAVLKSAIGVNGMVVIVGIAAVRVCSAWAVVVSPPCLNKSCTESVGVGINLVNRAFPPGVVSKKKT